MYYPSASLWNLKYRLLFWLSSAAIKKRMEKDVDEVGKIARSVKSKVEELDKEVNDVFVFLQ